MASEGSTLKLNRNHIGHSNKKELKKESDEREDIYISLCNLEFLHCLPVTVSISKGWLLGGPQT